MVDGAAIKKKRGRPKKSDRMVVVSVRVPESIYDDYCRLATKSNRSVHSLILAAVSSQRKYFQ